MNSLSRPSQNPVREWNISLFPMPSLPETIRKNKQKKHEIKDIFLKYLYLKLFQLMHSFWHAYFM